MKSKISCFNKTIFKKNLTLYWPLWAAYLLFLLAAVPLSLYQYMHLYHMDDLMERQFSALRNVFELATEPVILFAFCTLAVMCVFSYLYTAKNTNGMHGLPVTRLELFVTNTVSAFLFLAVPELISFIAGVFVGVSCGVTNIEILLYIFLFQLGMTFFDVSFASVIAMLTGHIMAMPVYCFIANYLYAGIRMVLEEIIISVTYGVSDLWGTDFSYILSPAVYLQSVICANVTYNQTLEKIDSISVSGSGAVAGYTAVGVLLFVLAYQLYRKRHLETAGDIIAVGFMKPIFRIGLGICGGMTLGLGLSELFHFNTVRCSDERFAIMLVCMVICILVGHFMAEMLMQKSFRIFKKRILIEAAVSVGFMVVFLSGLQADVFGLERKLPAQENVAMAFVYLDYPVKYEGEEVAELFDIHAQIIEQKDSNLTWMQLEEGNFYQAAFKYVLEDGSVFSRRYSLPIDVENPVNEELASGRILTKETEPELFKQHILGKNYDSNLYLSGYVNLYDQHQNSMEYRFSEEELMVISEAFIKDVEQGNYAYYELYSINDHASVEGEYVNEISLRFYNEEKIVRQEDEYYEIPEYYVSVGYEDVVTETASATYFSSGVDTDSLHIRFGENCTNLTQALEELGIVNDIWHLYTYNEYDALSEG